MIRDIPMLTYKLIRTGWLLFLRANPKMVARFPLISNLDGHDHLDCGSSFCGGHVFFPFLDRFPIANLEALTTKVDLNQFSVMKLMILNRVLVQLFL